MTISQVVVSYLKSRNLTQQKFYDLTGYAQVNLSNIISGRTKIPKIDFLQAVLRLEPEIDIKLFLAESYDESPFSEEVVLEIKNKSEIESEMVNKMWEQIDTLNKQIDFLTGQLQRCQEEKDALEK